ncbi:MAG: hypothetical protein J6M12_05810 [Clostridia bacterium]|nr:hypothetical protein [Clostridia bacterium]
MKGKLKALGIAENLFWGTMLLFWPLLIIVLIFWWASMNREERVQVLTAIISGALIPVVNIVPVIGQIASIVMLIFWIIGIVKFYKGDVDYKIILASQIANAIVKK